MTIASSHCTLYQDFCGAQLFDPANMGHRVPGACKEPGAALHSAQPCSLPNVFTQQNLEGVKEHGKSPQGKILLLSHQLHFWVWIHCSPQPGMKLCTSRLRHQKYQWWQRAAPYKQTYSVPWHPPSPSARQGPWSMCPQSSRRSPRDVGAGTARPSGSAGARGECGALPAWATLC